MLLGYRSYPISSSLTAQPVSQTFSHEPPMPCPPWTSRVAILTVSRRAEFFSHDRHGQLGYLGSGMGTQCQRQKNFCSRVEYAIVSARDARVFFFFLAEQVTQGFDAFRLYRSKSASLLVFNASWIDRRRFLVEKTLSSTSSECLFGRGGPEVPAAMNDSSAGDPPMSHIFALNTSMHHPGRERVSANTAAAKMGILYLKKKICSPPIP